MKYPKALQDEGRLLFFLGLAIVIFAAVITEIARMASWSWPPDDLPWWWACIGLSLCGIGSVREARGQERERAVDLLMHLRAVWNEEREGQS